MENKVDNLDDFLKSMINDIEVPKNGTPDENQNEQEIELENDSQDEHEEDTQEELENENEDSLDSNYESEDNQEEESGTEIEQEEEENLIEFEQEEEPSKSEDVEFLSNALGIEAKTKEELLEKVKEIKEIQELQKEIPSELAEAIRVAKEGGDYLEFLNISSINYDSYSNKELVEASIEKYFKLEDGTIDEEALIDYVESKSPAEINIMGDQIRENLKMKQAQKKERFLQSIKAQKLEEDKKIKSYLDKVNSISGVKLSPSDKETLFNEISKGSVMDMVVKNKNGEKDPQVIVENIFKIKYFDKVLSIAKTKSANEGKKEVIKKLTNSNVGKEKSRQTRAVDQNSKTKSGLDAYLEALKKGI